MVEPWSSKSYVWVRFLLPLLRIKKINRQLRINFKNTTKNLNKNSYVFKKNKTMTSESKNMFSKKPYFKFLTTKKNNTIVTKIAYNTLSIFIKNKQFYRNKKSQISTLSNNILLLNTKKFFQNNPFSVNLLTNYTHHNDLILEKLNKNFSFVNYSFLLLNNFFLLNKKTNFFENYINLKKKTCLKYYSIFRKKTLTLIKTFLLKDSTVPSNLSVLNLHQKKNLSKKFLLHKTKFYSYFNLSKNFFQNLLISNKNADVFKLSNND